MILLIFGAFVNSCLSYFLDFCFSEGNILEKWRPFIAKQLLLGKYSEGYLNNLCRDDLEEKAAEETFWYKPLFGCIFCANIWVGFASFWVVKAMFDLHFGYWLPAYYLAYLVMSHLFVKLMNKIEE